jgi:hypothetical protein
LISNYAPYPAWLAEPDNSVLVAVDGDRIVSVGAVHLETGAARGNFGSQTGFPMAKPLK